MDVHMGRVRTRSNHAYTLVDLIVCIGVLALILAMFLPMMTRNTARSARINCVNNLKQVGLSFRTFALDNNDKFPAQVPKKNGGTMELAESGSVYQHFLVMSNELSTPKILACPEDRDPRLVVANTFLSPSASTYAGNISFTNDNNTSYFVSIDAQDTSPSMILSGDKYLATNNVSLRHRPVELRTNSAISWLNAPHNGFGNVLLADGSVQQFSSTRLRTYLQTSSFETNRIAFP